MLAAFYIDSLVNFFTATVKLTIFSLLMIVSQLAYKYLTSSMHFDEKEYTSLLESIAKKENSF